MSWKPEVIADSSGKWVGNALRFATREEAEAYAKSLMNRWLLVCETRAVEVDEPAGWWWDPARGSARPILERRP